VHSIEIDTKKGPQFVRSMGAKCVYFIIDFAKRTALMKLPSKNTKTMPLDNHASLGLLVRTEKKFYPNTKAGFFIRNGRKPVSRGVARNPVDHPHGGRTKSIKNPLTPWGFPTKGR
jgi:large subunit ribosomal protein L2